MAQVLVFEVLLYYLAIDNLKLNDYEKTDSFICSLTQVMFRKLKRHLLTLNWK